VQRTLHLSRQVSIIARKSATAASSRQSQYAPNVSTAGFTLLEILVVLAVLGLLFVALLQENRFVLLGWDRQARLLSRSEDLDAVARTLRHLIEQAAPGSKWETLVFAGSVHSVTFTSVMPAAMEGMSPRRADVELTVDRMHQLMAVWTPHRHAVRVGPPVRPERTEILGGVERLDLSYLPAGTGAAWVSSWQDAALPRLVRVRMVFSDPGHASWPDILAAPMLQTQ
jgi:prepilin-type N-terminal cleavage/methylation domain-containing protein